MYRLIGLAFALLIPYVFSDSEPQREYILFERADVNLNGLLNQSEFDLILKKFDTNGDKRVTQAEFVKDWTDIYQLGAPVEAVALFHEADSDDDDVLTNADMVAFFGYFDMNNDGGIDMNEFLTQWGELKLVPETHVSTNNKTTPSPNGVLG